MPRLHSAGTVIPALTMMALTLVCFQRNSAHGFIAPLGSRGGVACQSAKDVGLAMPTARFGSQASSAQTLPVACLGLAAAWAFSSARPQRRRAPAANRRCVALAACAEEEELLNAISIFGTTDPDDMVEVRKALKKMPAADKGAFGALPGSWKFLWKSNKGRLSTRSAQLNFECSAFPATAVEITGAYNRVTDSEYKEIYSFTVPGGGGAEAAYVLSGKWTSGSSEGNWGAGAERVRCSFKFDTVRIVPSADAEASIDMVKAAKLDGFLEPKSFDGPSDYIDLQFMSDTARLHQNESGISFVLTRVADDGIPFAVE